MNKVLLMFLISAMCLTGCKSNEQQEIKDLQNQINKLEQQLNENEKETEVVKEKNLDVKEEVKQDVDVSEEKKLKEETKTEIEKGQCYDCGEYYPVNQMTFNGRSYHCGCANEYCEECKQEIPYGKEINIGDECWLCSSCYENYEDKLSCPYCGSQANPDFYAYGDMVCENCYNRIFNEQETTVTYNCVECGKDIVLDINVDARDLCDDCMNKWSYDEQYDETGHATRCWNCGSSNISYFDDYNYSCNDCGEFTQ